MRRGFIACLMALAAALAMAQSRVQDLATRATDVVKKVDLMILSQKEEEELGAEISQLLRERYGVVQDAAVHKYITLAGRVLAATTSSHPSRTWTFVVLDTDGVNAFAAPGGYVHITKGALALMRDEAELACVLGHEMGHVAEKHTLAALQKSASVQVAASSAGQARLSGIAQAAYASILENQWDQKDELEADKAGVTMANKAGYLSSGLSTFLTRLAEGRKDAKEPTGMFADYPSTAARVTAMKTFAVPPAFTATATMSDRFREAITFQPVAMASLATATASSTAAPAASAGSEPAKKRGGLRGMFERAKSAVTGQSDAPVEQSLANARGVNPDRDAKGGPIFGLVAVEVTQVEVDAFRQLIVAK